MVRYAYNENDRCRQSYDKMEYKGNSHVLVTSKLSRRTVFEDWYWRNLPP